MPNSSQRVLLRRRAVEVRPADGLLDPVAPREEDAAEQAVVRPVQHPEDVADLPELVLELHQLREGVAVERIDEALREAVEVGQHLPGGAERVPAVALEVVAD